MPKIEQARQLLDKLEESGVKNLVYLFITPQNFRHINSKGYSEDEILTDEEILEGMEGLQGYFEEMAEEEITETIGVVLDNREEEG